MSIISRLLAGSGARARLLAFFLALIGATLLSACGSSGGGGGGPVTPPLSITAQPADVTVVAGQPATLAVTASQSASYQWQQFVGNAWVAVTGATQRVLSIAAAQQGDDGAQYRVTVTPVNGGAAIISSVATLHVTPAPMPPAITLSPADLTLVEGQGGSLSVTATGTSITYQWQSSTDATTYADVPGATEATLVLAPVALADDGKHFRVVVTNAQGAVTSGVARLTVTPAPVAPTFSTVPLDTTAVAGQSATFVVAVAGVPVPTLAWQTSTDGATWTTLPGQTATSLVLASVSMSDNGKRFRAQATNPSGTVDTPSATLTVTPAPVAAFITSSPASVSVGVGATPSFHVVAGGTPAPTLQWQVSTDGGATFANVTGATAADLTLAAVVVGDDGKQLRVVATNATGTATSAAALLTVRPPPHISQQPQAQAWRSGLPTPQFQVAAAGTGLSYQWQLCNAVGGSCANIAGATAASVTVTPPAADASVRAIVTSAAGDSATSDPAGLARLHWTYVSGTPTGDTMRDLAWLDATTVVAVGDSGVVLRSTDSGTTWQATREAEAARQVNLRGVAFGSATVGVAVGDGGLLLRTSDGGQHWFVVGAGLTSQILSRVAFSDAQTAVAVGFNGAMLRSVDGGLSWASVNPGGADTFISVTFRGGVGLVLRSTGEIDRSINGGAQWTQTRAPQGGGFVGEVTFASDSVALAGLASDATRSTDGGLTWQSISPGVYWSQSTVSFKDASSGVALPGAERNYAFTTTDGGATWSQSANWPGTGAVAPLPGSHAGTAVRFSTSGIGIAAGSQGALLRTTDGGQTWTELDTSGVPQQGDLDGVAFASANVAVAWGSEVSKSLYRTIDGGVHWTVVGANVTPSDALGRWNKVVFSDSHTACAVDTNGHVARSTDGGATWQAGQDLGVGRTLPADMAFADASTGILVTGSNATFTTADGGQTWTPRPLAPSGRSVAWLTPTTVVMVASNGDVQRSTDAGVTWQLVRADGGFQNKVVRLSSSGQGVVAGQFGRLLHTNDGGVTWSDVSLPVSDETFAEGWFVSATEALVVGTNVWRTTDGGATWSLDLTSQKSTVSPWLVSGATPDGTASVAVGSRGIVMRRDP